MLYHLIEKYIVITMCNLKVQRHKEIQLKTIAYFAEFQSMKRGCKNQLN